MKITMTTGWLVTMTMLAVAALLPAESSAQGLFGTLQALQAENTQGLPLGTLVDTAPTNLGRSLRGTTVRDAASQSRTDTSHAMTQGIVTHNGTLAGIPLAALPPNIVIVVATQENVARPLPGEGTHDVAGVRLWWKRTGVEHWIGVVPSQAVETEGGGTCRRQGTR